MKNWGYNLFGTTNQSCGKIRQWLDSGGLHFGSGKSNKYFAYVTPSISLPVPAFFSRYIPKMKEKLNYSCPQNNCDNWFYNQGRT